MDSKLACLVLILAFYQVSSLSYDEAVTSCKKEYKIENDEPIDYFLANGVFQPGSENLKCFFYCLTSATGVADEKGSPQAEPLKKLASENLKAQELQLFSTPEIISACLPAKDRSTPCDAAFSYVKCAIEEQKALAAKAKTS